MTVNPLTISGVTIHGKNPLKVVLGEIKDILRAEDFREYNNKQLVLLRKKLTFVKEMLEEKIKFDEDKLLITK